MGESTAKRFPEKGAHVIVTDINSEGCCVCRFEKPSVIQNRACNQFAHDL